MFPRVEAVWVGFSWRRAFRPWEARSHWPLTGIGYIPELAEKPKSWTDHGHVFTKRGALKKAKIGLAELVTFQ